MSLIDLGLTQDITVTGKNENQPGLKIGRVITEHRERYIVSDGEHDYESEVTGNLRFSARSRVDFPAVGDWVMMAPYDSYYSIIHKILPRKSVIERKTAGKYEEKQIISANVDVAFIVQSIGNNFNINRLERYLTICYSGNVEPVVIITKTDLASDPELMEAVSQLEKREKKLKYILLSSITRQGFNELSEYIRKGKTYCFIGSSGVGKSTIINILLNKDSCKTGNISKSTGKGKHVTERRELMVLDSGGILIDTPGMKELGITDDIEGIKTTFQEIFDISLQCMFPDCSHTTEKGCAVQEALKNGIIDANSLGNYRRIAKEQQRFSSTVAERRRKERKFAKMCKEIIKEKKKSKF